MAEQNRARQRRYKDVEVKSAISQVRKAHGRKIAVYGLVEKLHQLAGAPGLIDGILAVMAFLAAADALSFYPLVVIIVLSIGLFAATVKKPFLGLVLLAVLLLPMIAYQMPALGWLYLVVMAASLIYGYMYNRTLLFMYALVAFAFSPIGYIFSIPLLVLAVLVVGYKRAVILTILFVLATVCLSGVTGVQNSSYIIYNATAAHIKAVPTSLDQYVVPSKHGFSILNFHTGMLQTIQVFTSGGVLDSTTGASTAIGISFTVSAEYYLVQMIIIAAIVFGIDSMAASSRSRYRGMRASLIGVGYPIIAVALSTAAKLPISYYTLVISFAITPIAIYLLEFNNVKIVKTLDIRKQDLRMKFGEAFEDLESGNVNETFDDIANYAATKRELIDAVLAPIEDRAISKAYNVNPAKGILFFGPPGTGKTLIMRALANEIHAGFFYVKASNIISAYPGETERMITNLFAIAKKHAPCVLFFDEIDTIARSRGSADTNDVSRQAVSQLLIEMDGFQKTSNVIMVGATNAPNLIDPAMMRPGRFDKIIYLPPPDYNARKQIFDLYLKKLPVSPDVNLDKLAEETERYTGADIKVLCETVAQRISQEAAVKHTILEITEKDILDRISATRPSVSMAQIEQYQKFRLDFERSVYGQTGEEGNSTETSMRDVIGLDEAKKVLTDAIETPLVHPELIKKYGIKSINGILIFGPPGTGKTMLLRAVKSEMAGITMLDLNGAELADQGVERATATIKETFDRAKSNAPSIILLDEVEEMVLKRGTASEYSAQITSEMLREIDGISNMSNVVVIGTTNRPDAIDAAALRPGRFDKLIFIKPPTKAQRLQMFKADLQGVPISDKVDYDSLAEQASGYTGADIYHVCREAKSMALDRTVKGGDEAKVEMDDLETIIQKTKPSAPESVIAQYLSFYSKYGER